MRIILAALAVASLLVLGACGQDPCPTLPRGGPELTSQVANGVEIEREVRGYECELEPDGSWTLDDEDEAHVGTTHRTTTKASPARSTTKAPKTSTSRSR
jgi:hypothetical protein